MISRFEAFVPAGALAQRRCGLALGLGLALCPGTVLRAVHAASDRPRTNVVLILADDLGYGDLRSYNPSSKIPTPHLDRLAAGGVRFTDAHSPSAVCTPTRYGLLTGRYCWRTRLKSSVFDGFSPPLIDPGQPTIASVLQAQGYQTACFGKWHLGMQWTRRDGSAESVDREDNFRSGEAIDFAQRLEGGPTGVGFDYFFGISASLDMPPYCWIENDRAVTEPMRMLPDAREMFMSVARGLMADDFQLERVLPTLKARAVEWIEARHRQQPARPFFLYLPLNSPHLPVVPSTRFAGKSGAGPYGDFLMETDDFVGAVIEALRRSGRLENTIVIFTADNGGLFHLWEPQEADDRAGYRPTPRGLALDQLGHRSNATLRGTKADIYEGGHRVPLIVHWPAGARPATTAVPVELTDLFATITEAVGVALPAAAAPDSFSFHGAIAQGAAGKSARPFLVHHSLGGLFAVREGDWKYVERRGSGGFSIPRQVTPGPHEGSGQLYDLSHDGHETKNLYQAEPERVRHFEELLRRIKASSALRTLAAAKIEKN